jgi:PadR family transcriptional regulator PadR
MVNSDKGDLLPGTLEMLILVTLRREPLHGYAIAQRIQQNSDELLRVEEGSLYPALQRRIRIYTLTASGRKQLGREMKRVGRVIDGIARVMRPSEA